MGLEKRLSSWRCDLQKRQYELVMEDKRSYRTRMKESGKVSIEFEALLQLQRIMRVCPDEDEALRRYESAMSAQIAYFSEREPGYAKQLQEAYRRFFPRKDWGYA